MGVWPAFPCGRDRELKCVANLRSLQFLPMRYQCALIANVLPVVFQSGQENYPGALYVTTGRFMDLTVEHAAATTSCLCTISASCAWCMGSSKQGLFEGRWTWFIDAVEIGCGHGFATAGVKASVRPRSVPSMHGPSLSLAPDIALVPVHSCVNPICCTCTEVHLLSGSRYLTSGASHSVDVT